MFYFSQRPQRLPMAGKFSDFHMEWTDVRNTSSTSIIDFGRRFLSDPSGGLVTWCVMGTSTGSAFSFWWQFASFFFLFMDLLPRTTAWMSVYGTPGIEKWKCFNEQANKMGCFVRGCWILQPNNAALCKMLHSVSAPFQGQICWCSPPPPVFNKRIYSIILEE